VTPRLSVVIPAHDEATIIAARLAALIATDPEGALEIVVVANGCTDATAEVAAAVSTRIRVVEVAAASKIAALNAGDAVATVFPRAYVDADVTVDARALLEIADAVRPAGSPHVGAPRLVVDTSRASRAVRAYYRIWALSEYRATGHVGSGVYVVSADGRARFGAFPDVIADDRFVQQLFPPAERYTSPDATFTVPAPRTYRALIRRGIRIASGNLQIAAAFPGLAAASASSRFSALLRRVATRPARWPDLAVYAFGYLWPRLRARALQRRGLVPGWNRDDTTRTAS
jgi:glycosyltransferase involved in cell wall biosynthesis